MNELKYWSKIILGGVLFLCSCTISANNTDDYSYAEDNHLIFETNPEPIDGKLDVYDSIARAVKYNAYMQGRELHKKVDNAGNLNPKHFLEKMVGKDDENLLYRALKNLDFAIMYANANIARNQKDINEYFYGEATKYLALEAIKIHQNIWLADRKEKNINALIRQEQKIADTLDKKEQLNGNLSDEEYDYNKNQKVLLMKLTQFKNSMNSEREKFIELVKPDTLKFELEGRRFYALDNFDKDYSLELFQETAVRNRKEFALANDFEQFLPYSQIRHYIVNRYPPVARLDVNGVKVEYDIYQQELYDKAEAIAVELITLVNEYKNSKTPVVNGLQKMLFDELSAAILTQIEVAYQLVMLADFNYENVANIEKTHRKELQRLKRLRHFTNDDKLAIFKAKITDLQIEQKKTQILAERAVALRVLYFNAGLFPIKLNLAKMPIENVAQDIRKGFNQDLVDMLSGVREQLQNEKLVAGQAGWAKSSGWLENVVANDTKLQRMIKQKIMQLGAYQEIENANKHWLMLVDSFPELKGYNKIISETDVNGSRWIRLQIEGSESDMVRICTEIKKKGYNCFLK